MPSVSKEQTSSFIVKHDTYQHRKSQRILVLKNSLSTKLAKKIEGREILQGLNVGGGPTFDSAGATISTFYFFVTKAFYFIIFFSSGEEKYEGGFLKSFPLFFWGGGMKEK